MLIEGLRAELPELFALAARLRPLAVPRMPLWAVVLGALGVRALTAQLLAGAHGVLSLFGLLELRTVEATTIASYAAATLFAFGAARWRGVAATVAALTLLSLGQLALAAPGRQLFCDRAGPGAPGDVCDTSALLAARVWPLLVGIGLGLLARRIVRRGRSGTSALALAVGVGALLGAAQSAIVPLVWPIPAPAEADLLLTWSVGAWMASAVVVGLVAGWWGRRHLLDAVVLVAYALAPWVLSLRSLLDARAAGAAVSDWRVFTPVGYAVSAILALAVAAVIRRSRPRSG